VSALLVLLAQSLLLVQRSYLIAKLARMPTAQFVLMLPLLENVTHVMKVTTSTLIIHAKSALMDAKNVLMEVPVLSVRKTSTEVLLVLHALLEPSHLLAHLPSLPVSVVLTTTVRLVAVVNPPENVLPVTMVSLFLQVVAWLAEITTAILVLELDLENAHHALLTSTC